MSISRNFFALVLLPCLIFLTSRGLAQQPYSLTYSTATFAGGTLMGAPKVLTDESGAVYIIAPTNHSGPRWVGIQKYASDGSPIFNVVLGAGATIPTEAVINGDSIYISGIYIQSSNTRHSALLRVDKDDGSQRYLQVLNLSSLPYENSQRLSIDESHVYIGGGGSINTNERYGQWFAAKVEKNTAAVVWTKSLTDVVPGNLLGTALTGQAGVRRFVLGGLADSNGRRHPQFISVGETGDTVWVRSLDQTALFLEQPLFASLSGQLIVGGTDTTVAHQACIAGVGLDGQGLFMDLAADPSANFLETIAANAAGDKLAVSTYSQASGALTSLLTGGRTEASRFAYPSAYTLRVVVPSDDVPHLLTGERLINQIGLGLRGGRGQFQPVTSVWRGDTPGMAWSGNKLVLVYQTAANQYEVCFARQNAVAREDTYETTRNQPLTRGASSGVLSNDWGTVGATASLLSVDHGSAVLQPTGVLSYSPPNAFTGKAYIQYRLTDLDGITSDSSAIVAVQPPILRIDAPAQAQGGNSLTARAVFDGRLVEPSLAKFEIPNRAATTVAVPLNASSVSALLNLPSVVRDEDTTLTCTFAGQTVSKAITILAPRPASLTLSPTSVVGSQPFTGQVTLTSDAGSGGVEVALTDNTSVIDVPRVLQIAGGEDTGSFTGTTSPVSAPAVRTVYATLNNTTRAANLTLHPGALTSFAVNPAELAGGTNTTGTVRVSGPAPAGGVTINVTSGSSVILTPATVRVPEGSSTTSFQIGTRQVGADVVRTVSVSAFGKTLVANVKLRPPFTIAQLTANPSTVQGGQSSVGTVMLNQVAVQGGSQVTLTSGSSVIQVPASVTVSGGQTTASFTITTSRVGATAVRQVTATIGSSTKAVAITINP